MLPRTALRLMSGSTGETLLKLSKFPARFLHGSRTDIYGEGSIKNMEVVIAERRQLYRESLSKTAALQAEIENSPLHAKYEKSFGETARLKAELEVLVDNNLFPQLKTSRLLEIDVDSKCKYFHEAAKRKPLSDIFTIDPSYRFGIVQSYFDSAAPKPR